MKLLQHVHVCTYPAQIVRVGYLTCKTTLRYLVCCNILKQKGLDHLNELHRRFSVQKTARQCHRLQQ